VLIARVPARAWVVLAVALALRLTLVAATFDTRVTLDPADFSRNGLSIAEGHGIPPSNRTPAGGPSAFRPPGYPLFLAAVYATVGEEAPSIARLVQALLGTLAVALTGLIAARIWGRRVGMLALGIAACAPSVVVMSTSLISEALFVPLVLAAVAAALEARRSSRPLRWAIVTGGLIGAAELTRTNAVVLLPPLAFAVWTARRGGGVRALLLPSAVVAAAVLTVAPWTVRNWLVFHAFVPVSTEVGYTLAGTYNLASRADHHWPAVWKEAEHGASTEYGEILFYASTQRWDERRLDDHLLAAATADIRRDPAYVLKVGVWNAIRMFHLGELDFAVANLRDTDIPRLPALVEIYGFYPLAILALAGIGTNRVRRAPLWLWLVPLCLATTIFVTGFIRFRASIDPFLVMLAALAVAALLERRKPGNPLRVRPRRLRSAGGHRQRRRATTIARMTTTTSPAGAI
jgi:4-amino-4-deoxy-L-arabinose transferase-like glycosyltransferase